MSKLRDIIDRYISGENTAEEVNAMLKEEGIVSFHLEPGKNLITPEEMAATVVSDDPDEVNGWGMLDTGTGTLDKVEIKNGTLVNCDCGEMYAICLVLDKMFDVDGTELAPYGTCRPKPGVKLPEAPNMKRRKDLANQVVEQQTKRGTYDVYYNELGYATKAVRK